jgi:hypothetical protein
VDLLFLIEDKKNREVFVDFSSWRLMAERGGFEPPIQLPVYPRSKRAPSATQPPLRVPFFYRFLPSLGSVFNSMLRSFFFVTKPAT